GLQFAICREPCAEVDEITVGIGRKGHTRRLAAAVFPPLRDVDWFGQARHVLPSPQKGTSPASTRCGGSCLSRARGINPRGKYGSTSSKSLSPISSQIARCSASVW